MAVNHLRKAIPWVCASLVMYESNMYQPVLQLFLLVQYLKLFLFFREIWNEYWLDSPRLWVGLTQSFLQKSQWIGGNIVAILGNPKVAQNNKLDLTPIIFTYTIVATQRSITSAPVSVPPKFILRKQIPDPAVWDYWNANQHIRESSFKFLFKLKS